MDLQVFSRSYMHKMCCHIQSKPLKGLPRINICRYFIYCSKSQRWPPKLLVDFKNKQLSCAIFGFKHRKNCECCHHHSLFKGLNVIVHIVVLNCQKCNQCLKCHVSGHKIFQKIWKLLRNLKTFWKSRKKSKKLKFSENLTIFCKS